MDRINTDPAFFNLIDYEEDSIRIMNAEKREEGIIQVAKNLKKSGMVIEDISKYTNLTKEQIEQL